MIDVPISDANYRELIRSLNQADKALSGDSNDAEHDALFMLTGAVKQAIGAKEQTKPRAKCRHDRDTLCCNCAGGQGYSA